jgi:hypothetical protein
MIEECEASSYANGMHVTRSSRISDRRKVGASVAIGTFETSGDVRSSVAIGGKPDVARTAKFGSERPAPEVTPLDDGSAHRKDARNAMLVLASLLALNFS